MYDLLNAQIGRQFPFRPLVLVGPSFGGLVIKQLCLHADRSASLQRRKETMVGFLNCIKGVFFYGTPHHGMPTFFTSKGQSTFFADASPLMEYVQLLSAESARLHEDFDALRQSHSWKIAGVGETRATTWGFLGFFRKLIAPEASARYGEFTMEDDDHISLCKPESRSANSYIRLTAFIRHACEQFLVAKGRHGNLQTVPKMAMTLQSHLLYEILDSLRTTPAISLCGMGGIGKTTLAKLLFNESCFHFEYTCFVLDMKLTAGDRDILNNKVKMCMRYRGKKMKEHEWDWDDLSDEAVCIVLDDIENDCHLEVLSDIQSKNTCGDSRYIVTSRNRDLLNRLYAPIFSVQKLSEESSRALFMSYAFPGQMIASPELTEYTDKIVTKCDGLPLTLEVMGKYLFRKCNENIWKQCLEALDEADSVAGLDERLWIKLKVSYDNLGIKEKEMFLTVATFFCNSCWTLRDAKASWRVLYGKEDLRWQILVDMSLVDDVGGGKTIRMHEQLRCLGTRLASGWGTGGICRTWNKNNVPDRFKSSNYGKWFAQVSAHTDETGPDSNRSLQPLSAVIGNLIQEITALRLEDSMAMSMSDIAR